MNNIDFSHITENRLKTLREKFKTYEELTDEWEEKHKDHSVTRYKHTVLKNGQGVEFECAKCYMCGVVAHKEIGVAKSVPEKFEKQKKPVKGKVKVNREVAGFHMLPGD